MNKAWVSALALFLAILAFSPQLLARESPIGGVEFSGNVDVVIGWQHDDGSAVDIGSCPLGPPGGGALTAIAGFAVTPGFGTGCNAADTQGSGRGILGDFRGLARPDRDTFNFYVDVVELDVQKAFGENVRIRADLDFGRFLSGSGRNTQAGSNFNLEQGYLTANIPVGNGLEFLIGRFNAPIGLESVDRIDNITLSYTNIFRYVRPQNITGAKFYYPFNDWFDWNIYVVNNLSDTVNFGNPVIGVLGGVIVPAGTPGSTQVTFGGDSAIPSYGTRFGFTWGKEEKENTLGLSYAGGPEMAGNNAHLTHIVDLDFMIHVADKFQIGGEAIYRQDNVGGLFNNLAAAFGVAAPTKNFKVWGASVLFAYAPSPSWDLWFRYGYLHDFGSNNSLVGVGATTGLNQQIHDFTIGTGYQITDGAKLKLEYRLDLFNYAGVVANAFTGGDTSSISQGVAAEFGYNF